MAVPFIPDEALRNNADHQLMQIERMLKELLVLTRWSTAMTVLAGKLFSIIFFLCP